MKKLWKKLLALLTGATLTGCTISVIDTHNEQGSTDSITESQSTDPKVKARAALQIPIKSDAPINVTPAPKK